MGVRPTDRDGVVLPRRATATVRDGAAHLPLSPAAPARTVGVPFAALAVTVFPSPHRALLPCVHGHHQRLDGVAMGMAAKTLWPPAPPVPRCGPHGPGGGGAGRGGHGPPVLCRGDPPLRPHRGLPPPDLHLSIHDRWQPNGGPSRGRRDGGLAPLAPVVVGGPRRGARRVPPPRRGRHARAHRQWAVPVGGRRALPARRRRRPHRPLRVCRRVGSGRCDGRGWGGGAGV